MNIFTHVYDVSGVLYCCKLPFSSWSYGVLFSYYCSRMKGVRDWVFSQILSKSLVSPSPLSASNSLYAGEHRNGDVNEQGTILNLLFDFEWNH